jgi:hypothetical protein
MLQRPTLGPERHRLLAPGVRMRVADDIRKTVVFLGYESSDPDTGGIAPFGTGFLLFYDEFPHLVTARHVAEMAGDNPFLIRVNRYDGTADNFPLDRVRWHYHPDPNVDVAAIPFSIKREGEYECFYIEDALLLTDELLAYHHVGIGDFCYTIGLFRLVAGTKRNMPVVHFGTIARMPEDEGLPMRDWRDPQKAMRVRSYLIESQSLSGLSGSPVFVRPTIGFDAFKDQKGQAVSLLHTERQVYLLGLWQGAWDALPGEVLSVEHGKSARVPVGMGVVVPTSQIIEALGHGEIKQMRDAARQRTQASTAAVPDAAQIEHPALPESDANPNHREDFTRLVSVAARKRPQGDQT